MSLLSVSPTALNSLAAFCESASAKVAVSTAPVTPAASFQPTAATVKAIHAETGLAGQTLSKRMLSTSGHVASSSAGYSAQDAEAADAMNDLVVNL